MDNAIQTSLDWPAAQTRLEVPVRRLNKYSHEMWNISHNIGLMVKELSKEEINCRRQGKQTRIHKEMVDKINQEIANYERMITFAVLLTG
jgi:PP-loop superfamily ATP-utilizing enzyme